MNLLKCPMPELLVGELVQYMRWSDDRNEWVSDAHDFGIAHCFDLLPVREGGQTAAAVAKAKPLTPWPAPPPPA